MQPDRSLVRRAILALIVVNALWGGSFPIMKCLNLQMDAHFGVDEATASASFRIASASWIIGIRFAVALLFLFLLMPGTLRRVGRPEAISGIVIGTFFFLGLLLQMMGLSTISASRSGFLTSLVVIVTPLYSTVVRRRLPRGVVLAGAALAFFGVMILTGIVEIQDGRMGLAADAWGRWRIGDTLTLLGTLSFATQVMLVDGLGKRYDSVGFTPTMFATTSILALATFAIAEPRIPETSPTGWIALLVQPEMAGVIAFLCFFPSLIAFSLMNRFQPVITASQAAVMYTLEPLFASTWALFVPGILSVLCGVTYANEPFTLSLVVGGAIVLVADLFALWPERREVASAPTLAPDSHS